jgi:hypothetical protein
MRILRFTNFTLIQLSKDNGEPSHRNNTAVPQEPTGYLRTATIQLVPGVGLTLRSTAPRDPNREFALDPADHSVGPELFYSILHAFYSRLQGVLNLSIIKIP